MSLASERRAAVERAFPGVSCSRVALEIVRFEPSNLAGNGLPERSRYTLSACVRGTAEVLIAHGLLTQKKIDALPASGKTYSLKRLPDGSYQASLHWMDWVHHGDGEAYLEGREMAAKIGITAAAPKEVKRSALIRGRAVWWHCSGKVVRPNWDLVREQARMSRGTAA